MRNNFEIKLSSLSGNSKTIKTYSHPNRNNKQALIPSSGISLFLTYKEDKEALIRYITDIEILRK